MYSNAVFVYPRTPISLLEKARFALLNLKNKRFLEGDTVRIKSDGDRQIESWLGRKYWFAQHGDILEERGTLGGMIGVVTQYESQSIDPNKPEAWLRVTFHVDSNKWTPFIDGSISVPASCCELYSKQIWEQNISLVKEDSHRARLLLNSIQCLNEQRKFSDGMETKDCF